MAQDAEIDRVRKSRDKARSLFVLGIGLLFIFGIGFGSGRVRLGGWEVWLFVGAMAVAATGALSWMYWGWTLHRKNDPWRYDPELDGPDPEHPRTLDEQVREHDKP